MRDHNNLRLDKGIDGLETGGVRERSEHDQKFRCLLALIQRKKVEPVMEYNVHERMLARAVEDMKPFSTTPLGARASLAAAMIDL